MPEATLQWNSGAASDTGLQRAHNEDRFWIDDELGVFLVADGVGGYAAGEFAAQTAVDEIREALRTGEGDPEARVRGAITRANNRIFDLARGREELRGMACVLTLALVDGQHIVIGHVGDSRLYLIWKGAIRKLTSDHSPVGESEDAGELTEAEAMAHPRRNEVFRDVGSQFRQEHDRDFIEVRRFHFKPDAAFLICSDGLTDQVTAAGIREIVDRYDGDPDAIAQQLVAAANDAGGKDNITALLVCGPQFRGQPANATAELAVPVLPRARRRWFTGRFAFLVYGVLIGMLVWAAMVHARG